MQASDNIKFFDTTELFFRLFLVIVVCAFVSVSKCMCVCVFGYALLRIRGQLEINHGSVQWREWKRNTQRKREKEKQTPKGERKKRRKKKNADKKGANISNDRSVTFVLYDWNEFRMKDREIKGKILLKWYNFWWEPRHNKFLIEAGVD